MEDNSIKKRHGATRRGPEPRTFRFRDEWCSDHCATDAGARINTFALVSKYTIIFELYTIHIGAIHSFGGSYVPIY